MYRQTANYGQGRWTGGRHHLAIGRRLRRPASHPPGLTLLPGLGRRQHVEIGLDVGDAIENVGLVEQGRQL